jgi:hypothetical protein
MPQDRLYLIKCMDVAKNDDRRLERKIRAF